MNMKPQHTLSRLIHRTMFERKIQGEYPQLNKRWPHLGGRPVDLYYLYQLVMSHGGYTKFHNLKLWQSYTRSHGVPASCTSSGTQLSKMYNKYLLGVERQYRAWQRPSLSSSATSSSATSSSATSLSTSPSNSSSTSNVLPVSVDTAVWCGPHDSANDGAAALACGFKVSTPNDLEIQTFGHLGTCVFAGSYLEVRNHILIQWTTDVSQYVSIERVLAGVSLLYHVLIARVYDFLEIHGYINVYLIFH